MGMDDHQDWIQLTILLQLVGEAAGVIQVDRTVKRVAAIDRSGVPAHLETPEIAADGRGERQADVLVKLRL